MNNHSYWLNAFTFGHEEQRSPEGLGEHKAFPFHESYGGECPGVYYVRLQRDGWRLQCHTAENRSDAYSVFSKELPKGWALEKTAHATINHPVGKGCYYDTHRLIHPERGVVHEFADWEWADFDRNRLLWVEKGILYKSQVSPKGVSYARALYDFNPMDFEALAAPY